MSGWGILDGRGAPVEELAVPVTDRGLLLGDAVFETLRTYGGRLFALEPHLDRLVEGMASLRFRDPPSRDLLAAEARAAVRAVCGAGAGEAVVRLTVTRGSGPRGLSTRSVGPVRRLVLGYPLSLPDAAWYDAGVAVVTARTRRVPIAAQDPRIKSTSALNLVLARLEADDAGAEDALLCDDAGRYLEATAANLFVIRDDAYHTARAEDGVLPGVTAGIVAGILDDMGLRATRGPVPREVLAAADEVWLTQTTRELIAVSSVDGEPVGTGRPGPLAAKVRERFRKEVPKWLDHAD